MKNIISFYFLTMLLLKANTGYTQDNKLDTILFIGNSYTYFWNLPHHVSLMAEATGIDISTHQSTAGGANWAHHLRGERNLKTVSILTEGKYDAIILQNHSMSTIQRKDSFEIFGQQLVDIAKSGTKVFLYQTWSREWDPYMFKTISEGYKNLADKIDAQVVPVGKAWQRARSLRPDFPIYDNDGSHPSPLGTYLTACVFYGAITGNSPVGLPGRLITKDHNDGKTYINLQSDNDALFCQKVAADILDLK